MKTVPINTEIKIHGDSEVTVEVSYRCHFATGKAFYPMTILGSIYETCSLQEFIKRGKERYEKDYIKVEVVKVEIDEEELTEYSNSDREVKP